MSKKAVQTDVAVIGAGTAGMVAYRAAVKAGKRAVIIESGPYGTMCARVGCMPSKLLIAAATAADAVKQAPEFGVRAHIDAIDGKRVMQRVKSERDRFVNFVLNDVDSFNHDDKIRGHARFINNNRIAVDKHTIIETSATVIATGSVSNTQENLNNVADKIIFNDDVFDWDNLPSSLLVVGTGIIGLELGQALSKLGVSVTIINRSDSLAGLKDPAVRAEAVNVLKNSVNIKFNTTISSASIVDNKVVSTLVNNNSGDSETITTDYILMAIGRRPAIDNIGLENTSAKLLKNGKVKYDRSTLKIESAPIFIAGDANGNALIQHEASDDGYIAGTNAAMFPELKHIPRRASMGIVFTEPQVAFVGIRYSDLPETGVIEGEVSFNNQGRSRIMLRNQGLLKVYADSSTGLFLGAEMIGPSAEHIAHLLAWSYQQQLTIKEMLEMPFYHPVVEEGVRTALRNAARQILD